MIDLQNTYIYVFALLEKNENSLLGEKVMIAFAKDWIGLQVHLEPTMRPFLMRVVVSVHQPSGELLASKRTMDGMSMTRLQLCTSQCVLT
jgi:hypothetical protein